MAELLHLLPCLVLSKGFKSQINILVSEGEKIFKEKYMHPVHYLFATF